MHILATAAACTALGGKLVDARRLAARIREKLPGYTVGDFLRAFQFDADTRAALSKGLRQIGFDPVK